MTIEIMETKLERKKHEISCMVEDMKALKQSAMLLNELGYDNTDLVKIYKDIQKDIDYFSREAVRMKNAILEMIKTEKLREI